MGVGAEFGLTRQWSAKGEVNVIWFDDDEITASDGTGSISAQPSSRPRSA